MSFPEPPQYGERLPEEQRTVDASVTLEAETNEHDVKLAKIALFRTFIRGVVGIVITTVAFSPWIIGAIFRGLA